ncbi:hypothetical protein KFE96_00590 [Kordiimonas sp. SCSIO 12603]|uniref:hypothetical protein n=1 Tax=Kordiimonas sp. SCSIO 12603 TaxID=2829596 RepID=UPI0021071971|nr:hypothetical protein [Kordiimonas sp. SCSIO 12603]UTW58840.1 hypothetical protein KFE96_00590 [Kordiimonas sp. SCSIO 12603]
MNRQINVFDGARQFMLRWDYFKTQKAPSAHGRLKLSTRRSLAGNLNQEGTSYASRSTMFFPSQDGFWDAVEEGVKPLVLSLAIHHDFITYTSCEGHLYAQSNEDPDERHIGIIPRSTEEYQRCLNLLTDSCIDHNTKNDNSSTSARVLEHTLIDYEERLPVIDLILEKKETASWETYFDELDYSTKTLADFIDANCKKT